jgi:hypothetical protein
MSEHGSALARGQHSPLPPLADTAAGSNRHRAVQLVVRRQNASVVAVHGAPSNRPAPQLVHRRHPVSARAVHSLVW